MVNQIVTNKFLLTESFQLLLDDDDVNVLVPCLDARLALDGDDAGEEVEGAAELHVHGLEAAAAGELRDAHGAAKANAVATNRLHLGDSVSGLHY